MSGIACVLICFGGWYFNIVVWCVELMAFWFILVVCKLGFACLLLVPFTWVFDCCIVIPVGWDYVWYCYNTCVWLWLDRLVILLGCGWLMFVCFLCLRLSLWIDWTVVWLIMDVFAVLVNSVVLFLFFNFYLFVISWRVVGVVLLFALVWYLLYRLLARVCMFCFLGEVIYLLFSVGFANCFVWL